jgi:hypothetical protein
VGPEKGWLRLSPPPQTDTCLESPHWPGSLNLYLAPSWSAASFRLPFLPPYIIFLIPSIVTSAPKMETVCFSETLASTNQSTWCLNPEEHIIMLKSIFMVVEFSSDD